jgi:hypothetical protein
MDKYKRKFIDDNIDDNIYKKIKINRIKRKNDDNHINKLNKKCKTTNIDECYSFDLTFDNYYIHDDYMYIK